MGLPRIIKALLERGAYPHAPRAVELRQTHISYILLAGSYVYKIKKPVDFGFLDFSTLSKRRFYCSEEVRLNSRLAKGVYLGVVPVTLKGKKARMEGKGRPVEYAVKMKRIPEESILEGMVERGEAGPKTLARVARRLAAFHRLAATDERIASFGLPASIKRNTDENFSQTAPFVGDIIPPRAYRSIRRYTNAFLRDNRALLLRRAKKGMVRDCHGDVHTEHVSVANGIDIFDCIEFNERFRFSDTAADAAFLSMDLDFKNRHGLACAFERAYLSASGDREAKRLLGFYRCYRAYVRAKVDGFKYLEAEVPEDERLRAYASARLHLHLAALYARGGFAPTLVVVRGLSGAGKSTVSAALSEAASMPVLSSDAVRKGLAGLALDESAEASYGKGIYSPAFTQKTYRELLKRAGGLLKEGRSVVIDATFADGRRLDEAKSLAARKGAIFRVVECTASEREIKKRLAKRPEEKPAPGAALSDARWEIYLRQKKEFSRAKGPGAVVDTSRKGWLKAAIDGITC